jgi:maltose O-acetyltransferase
MAAVISVDARVSAWRRAVGVVREELSALHLRLWLAQTICAFLPPFVGARLRTSVLRMAGITIGNGTVIGGRVWIAGGRRPPARVSIGNDCFVNDGVRLDTSAGITIGDNVAIGHGVAIVTSSHEIGDRHRRSMAVTAESVVIGSGSWIGARAVILPGVTVGEGAIVAAGAVVVRSVAPSTLVGGAPARLISELD